MLKETVIQQLRINQTKQAGTYQDQTGKSTCKSCATDTFSSAGRSSCDYEATTCPKGTFASGTEACTSCVAGKYKTI